MFALQTIYTPKQHGKKKILNNLTNGSNSSETLHTSPSTMSAFLPINAYMLTLFGHKKGSYAHR